MKEVIIPLSKLKIGISFLGCIAVSLLFSYFVQIIIKDKTIFEEFHFLVVFIFFIFILILSAFYHLYKLFDSKPGIIINERGIVDNSNFVSVGLIRWENITNIKINKVYGQKQIVIEINNPDETILNQKNPLKRFFMKFNKDHFNSPILLSSVALNCKFDDLYKIIKEQFSLHSSNGKDEKNNHF